MKRVTAFIKLCLVTAILVLGLSAVSHAQVTLDWSSISPGSSGSMVALDQADNAYVAASGLGSMLLFKYSPTGLEWLRQSFAGDQSTWVTVDGSGNVIVTGRSGQGVGGSSVVQKYDPNGTLLWQDVTTAWVDFTSLDVASYASRAVTDSAGNIYVLGKILGFDLTLTNISRVSLVTVKYPPGGPTPTARHGEWVRTLATNLSVDTPAAIALTPAGNVVVAGAGIGTMQMAVYDSNGNLLTNQSAPATTGATDVAVGPSGEVVIAGSTSPVGTVGIAGVTGATATGYQVIKYDAATFAQLWSRIYSEGQFPTRVAVDSQGDVIVTGTTSSTTSAFSDWMTIKTDPNGALLWSRRVDLSTVNNEAPYFMLLGDGDTIYITGGSQGTTTVKYLRDGTELWSTSDPSSNRGVGAALASDNGLFVLGESPLALLHYQQANLAPFARAAASPTSGTAPLTVSFSSAGSSDPDGTIVGRSWNFGDGTSSLEANPTHTFAAGSYSVVLTATDNQGASAVSAPIAIQVSAPVAVPTSLSLNPATIVGGRNSIGTVTVSTNSGVTVKLASNNTNVAKVPDSVKIPAGATSASFKISTRPVKKSTTVSISASANGTTIRSTLTVTP